MKIEIKKIPFQKREFEATFDKLKLKGVFYKDKEKPHLVKIDAVLSGSVEVECIKCLKNFEKEVNENLKLIITDKIFNGFDEEFDVIEINSNVINFDDIILSEIESIKLDYNVCDKCKNREIDVEI